MLSGIRRKRSNGGAGVVLGGGVVDVRGGSNRGGWLDGMASGGGDRGRDRGRERERDREREKERTGLGVGGGEGGSVGGLVGSAGMGGSGASKAMAAAAATTAGNTGKAGNSQTQMQTQVPSLGSQLTQMAKDAQLKHLAQQQGNQSSISNQHPHSRSNSGHHQKAHKAHSRTLSPSNVNQSSLSSFPNPNQISLNQNLPMALPHLAQLLMHSSQYPDPAATNNLNSNPASTSSPPQPSLLNNSNPKSSPHPQPPPSSSPNATQQSAPRQSSATGPSYFVPVSSPNPYSRQPSRPAPPQPTDQDAALIAAVESRSILRVRDALSKGAKPSARKWVKFSCRVFRDWERKDGRVVTKDLGELRHDVALGESALALAIMVGQADIAEALLDAGGPDLVHDPVEWTLWAYHLPWTHDDWTRKRVACTFTFNSALSFALGAGRVTSADGLPLLDWQRDLDHAHTLRVNKKGGVVRLVDPQWSSERCDEVTVRPSAEVVRLIVKRGGLVTERVADAAKRLARRDILQALGMNPQLAPSSASASNMNAISANLSAASNSNPQSTTSGSVTQTSSTPPALPSFPQPLYLANPPTPSQFQSQTPPSSVSPIHPIRSSSASLVSTPATAPPHNVSHSHPNSHRPPSLISLPVPPPQSSLQGVGPVVGGSAGANPGTATASIVGSVNGRPISTSELSLALTGNTGGGNGAGQVTNPSQPPTTPTPRGALLQRPHSAATAPAAVGGSASSVGGVGAGLWKDLSFAAREREKEGYWRSGVGNGGPGGGGAGSRSIASVSLASVTGAGSVVGSMVWRDAREREKERVGDDVPLTPTAQTYPGAPVAQSGMNFVTNHSTTSPLRSPMPLAAAMASPSNSSYTPVSPYLARAAAAASASVAVSLSAFPYPSDSVSIDPSRRASPPPSPSPAPSGTASSGVVQIGNSGRAPSVTVSTSGGMLQVKSPAPLPVQKARHSVSSMSLSLSSLAAALVYPSVSTSAISSTSVNTQGAVGGGIGGGGASTSSMTTAPGFNYNFNNNKPLDDLLKSHADLELRLASMDAGHRRKLSAVERERDEWRRRAEAAQRECEAAREREARLIARMAELEGRGVGAGRTGRRAGSARGVREGSPLGLGSSHGGTLGVGQGADLNRSGSGRRSVSSSGTGGENTTLPSAMTGFGDVFRAASGETGELQTISGGASQVTTDGWEFGVRERERERDRDKWKRPGMVDSGVGVVW
ncbi:hypothetical protein HDU93_009402 [Gonapodya sp. JEL0774]|nr:hypothetical protein HDU93_009402 [Gonapodya sp. JEL0774]